MTRTQRMLGGLAASLAIPATAALSSVWVCYVPFSWLCCDDWTIKCQHSSIVEPPESPVITNWYCLQDSDAAGFGTIAAQQAQNGQHLSSDVGQLRGTCTVTPSRCGALPNQCIIGAPYQMTCRDSVLYGTCTTNP